MSKSKHRNTENRKALLERAYFFGLTINRKYCPRIKQVPNLAWLWKNGMVKMERRGPPTSAWTSLVPTQKGLEYLGTERLADAIKRYNQDNA